MNRKWVLLSILATLLVAAAAHFATLAILPNRIMGRYMATRQANSLEHTGQNTYKSKDVARPNADMYISNSVYDLSKGPLLFTAKVPVDHYWSVAFYASNSDNFFVINDQQVKSNPVRILLVTTGMKYANPDNAQVVISPSIKGVLLIRQAIPGPDRLDEVADLQKQSSIAPQNMP